MNNKENDTDHNDADDSLEITELDQDDLVLGDIGTVQTTLGTFDLTIEKAD